MDKSFLTKFDVAKTAQDGYQQSFDKHEVPSIFRLPSGGFYAMNCVRIDKPRNHLPPAFSMIAPT
jgi:hypothetical protein